MAMMAAMRTAPRKVGSTALAAVGMMAPGFSRPGSRAEPAQAEPMMRNSTRATPTKKSGMAQRAERSVRAEKKRWYMLASPRMSRKGGSR